MSKTVNESMNKIRKLIKEKDDKSLIELWEKSKVDLSNAGIVTNAIIEAELEYRKLIRMNEETMEYEMT